MRRTQKNKATEHHLGLLKSKLARYRVMLLEPPKTAAKVQGFEVTRQGDARVCLIGFPSVGKSTLLNTFTGGEQSAAAAYEFTTLTCVPGKIHYKNAEVQYTEFLIVLCRSNFSICLVSLKVPRREREEEDK
jgi:ribosome-interacting GTPase 1